MCPLRGLRVFVANTSERSTGCCSIHDQLDDDNDEADEEDEHDGDDEDDGDADDVDANILT